MVNNDRLKTNDSQNQEKKENDQQKLILKETVETLSSMTNETSKVFEQLSEKYENCSRELRELEQEKNILEEISKENEKLSQKTHKKSYTLITLIAVIVSIGFVGYFDYENQVLIKVSSHDMSSYNSNYVIQNLQGDTVDTWVSWNIANGRIIHVHVTNEAKLSQDMINAMEDAIMSTKTVSIDDSQTGKGPKGSSSTYYVGWEGASAAAYSESTKLFIPQKFDINGSPGGVGDIEIILTNDINPDGYSGYTKSLVDGNEILKSKITIYKANKLDADRLEAIMRHEFGHALGLGHSTAQEDLMHPMLPDYPYISSCDIDALKGLYDGDDNSKVVCTK